MNTEAVPPTMDMNQILKSELAQVVRCKRKDGSEYIVIHPVQIEYENKLYTYGSLNPEIIELPTPHDEETK